MNDLMRVVHFALEADGVVDHEELVRVAPLVDVIARRYRLLLPAYEQYGSSVEGASDGAAPPHTPTRATEEFIALHRTDTQNFGFGCKEPWRAIACARLVRNAVAQYWGAARVGTPVNQCHGVGVRR